MKKILYATDFSEKAEKALVYALELAHKNDAELMMLHIYKNPKIWEFPYLADGVALEKEAVKEAKNNLKTLFKRYEKRNGKKVKVKYLAKVNISVAYGIITVIEDYQPDVLVIGTKGESSRRDLFFGSTAKDLTKQAPCPVLAIPQKAKYKDFKNIVYASDLYEDDIKAINQLIVLLNKFAPSVTMVHVNPQEEPNGDAKKLEWFKNLVKEKIGYEDIGFNVLLSDDFCKILNDYISYYGANLLVMLEKERKGIIDRVFQGDHVTKMEFHTKTPILIFNEHYLGIYPEKSKDKHEVEGQ